MTAVVRPTFRLADGREKIREQLEAAAALAIAVRMDEHGIILSPEDCVEMAQAVVDREIEKVDARLAEEQRTWDTFDETDVLEVDWSKLLVTIGGVEDDPPQAG